MGDVKQLQREFSSCTVWHILYVTIWQHAGLGNMHVSDCHANKGTILMLSVLLILKLEVISGSAL